MVSNLDIILLDYFYCEWKAVGVVLNLMFCYFFSVKFIKMLIVIVCEELEYF